MKTDIHPNYVEADVTCSCGNTFKTRSTKADLHVELCNECHPFFTGKQKLVDSGGRVERFRRRYAKVGIETDADKTGTAAPAAPAASAAPEPADVETTAPEPAAAEAAAPEPAAPEAPVETLEAATDAPSATTDEAPEPDVAAEADTGSEESGDADSEA